MNDLAKARRQRLRVLHFIHTMAYGGVETAVLNWVRELDSRHFEVHLVCFANPGGSEQPFVDAAQRLGFEVTRIPWGRHKPIWRAAGELAAMVRERSIDIVHAHNCYADIVTAVAARRVRVKTITTAYVWFDFNWKRNLLQWLDAQAMRCFDRVTAHCESTRDETIRRGFRAESIRTLVCGFETHRIELSPAQRQAERSEAGAGPQDTVLINVARFYPEKAHIFLIETFARILAQRPDTWLWLAGVGPLEAQIRAAIAEHKVGHRVRMLGFVVELPHLLALADIQVHPAHIEGVPLAICEGMAAGLPIVASHVGGLPEVLAHGRNGTLIPTLDEGLFADAVIDLIDHPDEARRQGAQARSFIENDYSLRSAVTEVEAVYRELAAC